MLLNKNKNKGSNTRRASTAKCIRLIYNTIHVFYRYTEWTNGVSCAGIVASLPTYCIVGFQTFLILSPNYTTARLRQYGGISRPPPRLIAVSGIITNHTRHQERYLTPNERKLTSAKTMSYLCIGNGRERLSPNPSAREGIGYNRNARTRFNRTSRARWSRASKTCRYESKRTRHAVSLQQQFINL